MSVVRGAIKGVSDERGSAAVEFALVSVLLLMLIVGMVSIALLFQAQVAVTNAAREGARLAAVDKFSVATVRSRAGVPNPALLQASLSLGSDAGGEYAQVVVTYPVTLGLPRYTVTHGINILSSTTTVRSTARMKLEY